MVIKVLRINELDKKLDNISKQDLSAIVLNATHRVQSTAKGLAPINKNPKAPTRGQLRASIRAEVRKASNGEPYGRIWTNVFYSLFVEFGTRFMRAQPFLRPGLELNRPGIINDIKKAYRSNLRTQAK